jgi:hypothetical protein
MNSKPHYSLPAPTITGNHIYVTKKMILEELKHHLAHNLKILKKKHGITGNAKGRVTVTEWLPTGSSGSYSIGQTSPYGLIGIDIRIGGYYTFLNISTPMACCAILNVADLASSMSVAYNRSMLSSLSRVCNVAVLSYNTTTIQSNRDLIADLGFLIVSEFNNPRTNNNIEMRVLAI